MSLLRLLTAGKSLVGLKKSESRYQLPGSKSLPRFGSKKNPFRATVFPEKSENAAVAEAPSGPPVTFSSDTTPPIKAGNKSELAPEISNPDRDQKRLACSVPGERTSEAPATDPAGQVVKRSGFKAFLLWRRVKPKSFAQFSGRPMVQGELSLDAIKVVRNDLSESDLEVIQSRPAEAAKAAKNSDADAVAKRSVSEPDFCSASGLMGAAKM